jgi:ABC-type nitrate/sulfonate/bicarbonate transport system substrate-binding protein
MNHLSKRLRIGLVCLSLFLLSSVLTIACNPQQSSTNTDATKTLIVGITPWPGYAAHNVAMAKGFFKEAGLSIKEEKFASQTDSDTAFLAGEVVFSSKNSNIIPDGITAREAFIKNRQPELVSYLQAIDKAVKLIREDPIGTAEAIAKSLGITAAEVPAQMGGVKLYDLQMNKAITFNKAEPMNLFASLEFATQTATEMKLIPNPIDVDVAMDKTTVHAA